MSAQARLWLLPWTREKKSIPLSKIIINATSHNNKVYDAWFDNDDGYHADYDTSDTCPTRHHDRPLRRRRRRRRKRP